MDDSKEKKKLLELVKKFDKLVPPSVPIPKEPTFLERVVNRFISTFPIFRRKVSSHHKLVGRIQELNQKAEQLLNELEALKNKLNTELDIKLYQSIEKATAPIEKEYQRIISITKRKRSMIEETRLFKDYAQWMDKVEMWIEICKKTREENVLSQVILESTKRDVEAMIERDLRLIHDYHDHSIRDLGLGEKDLAVVQKKIHKELEHHIEQLIKLKDSYKPSSMEETADWKKKIDKQRQVHFENALHVIDKNLEEIKPKTTPQSVHLTDLFSRVVYLENEMEQLGKDLQETDLSDDLKNKWVVYNLSSLEEEAHKLNLDLRLPPDLCNRLQNIMEKLSDVHRFLKEDEEK